MIGDTFEDWTQMYGLGPLRSTGWVQDGQRCPDGGSGGSCCRAGLTHRIGGQKL